MNERIRELADDAGFIESWFSESGDDCERELRKFAELIVKECAEFARQYNLEKATRSYMINKAMRQHFGVE